MKEQNQIHIHDALKYSLKILVDELVKLDAMMRDNEQLEIELFRDHRWTLHYYCYYEYCYYY
jgi:hypothetical protein